MLVILRPINAIYRRIINYILTEREKNKQSRIENKSSRLLGKRVSLSETCMKWSYKTFKKCI